MEPEKSYSRTLAAKTVAEAVAADFWERVPGWARLSGIGTIGTRAATFELAVDGKRVGVVVQELKEAEQ